jgi:hypothetical protein
LVSNVDSPLWPLHLRVSIAGPPTSEVMFAAHWHENGDCTFYIPARSGDDGAFEAGAPKYEGFWRSSADEPADLPWPVKDERWSDRPRFLEALNEGERISQRVAYRGFSNCRICGCRNGFESLRMGGWEWPAGFRHYVEVHLVRPTDDFIRFILGGAK